MCLTVTAISKTQNDVFCYKLVQKAEFGYYSYIQQHYFIDSISAKTFCNFNHIKHMQSLESEVVHAFMSLDTAVKHMRVAYLNKGRNLVILKCVIPKNSDIVLGCNDDVGAKFIKIIEEVCV